MQGEVGSSQLKQRDVRPDRLIFDRVQSQFILTRIELIILINSRERRVRRRCRKWWVVV